MHSLPDHQRGIEPPSDDGILGVAGGAAHLLGDVNRDFSDADRTILVKGRRSLQRLGQIAADNAVAAAPLPAFLRKFPVP